MGKENLLKRRTFEEQTKKRVNLRAQKKLTRAEVRKTICQQSVWLGIRSIRGNQTPEIIVFEIRKKLDHFSPAGN